MLFTHTSHTIAKKYKSSTARFYVHQILTCLHQFFQGRPTWSPLLLYMKLDDFYEVRITWILMACKATCPANIMHGWMNFSREFILLCKMNDKQSNVGFRSRKISNHSVKAVAPFAKCFKSVPLLICCVVGLGCYKYQSTTWCEFCKIVIFIFV